MLYGEHTLFNIWCCFMILHMGVFGIKGNKCSFMVDHHVSTVKMLHCGVTRFGLNFTLSYWKKNAHKGVGQENIFAPVTMIHIANKFGHLPHSKIISTSSFALVWMNIAGINFCLFGLRTQTIQFQSFHCIVSTNSLHFFTLPNPKPIWVRNIGKSCIWAAISCHVDANTHIFWFQPMISVVFLDFNG